MKTISKTAIVALMTATVGLTAIAPAAYAQTAPEPQVEGPQRPGQFDKRFHRQGDHGPGMRHVMIERMGAHGPHAGVGMLNLLSSPEALEIAFVRLSYAIDDMSDEQKALFDTLKTEALAAQASFAEATEGLRFDPRSQDERPEITELFDNRIAIDTARLEAMTTVQPAFDAFFSSLTDEQKADLAPARMRHHTGQPGGPKTPAPMEAPAEAPAEG